LKKPAGTAVESGGDPVTVLAIGAGAGMAELQRILGHSRWTVLQAGTLAEARGELRKDGVVVVCEATLPDGTWKDVLDHALRLPAPPPVIVTSPHADDFLWMEVLNLGGYNVLGRPFREREVFQLVSMAWLRRRDNAQPRLRVNAIHAT
jgi:DNA-binding response OmpR family regulator